MKKEGEMKKEEYGSQRADAGCQMPEGGCRTSGFWRLASDLRPLVFLLSAFFILHSAFGQAALTAPGLAAFIPPPAAGGGGGGPCTPSYTNNGGTGDRRAIISTTLSVINATSLARLIDGDKVSNGRNFFNGNTLDGTSKYIIFDFGSGNAVNITEAKYYQQDGSGQGTWKWQGSNDASSWTDIGGTFSLATAATTTLTTLSSNTSSYRYYKLLGMSGATSNGPWIYQLEFKICGI